MALDQEDLEKVGVALREEMQGATVKVESSADAVSLDISFRDEGTGVIISISTLTPNNRSKEDIVNSLQTCRFMAEDVSEVVSKALGI